MISTQNSSNNLNPSYIVVNTPASGPVKTKLQAQPAADSFTRLTKSYSPVNFGTTEIVTNGLQHCCYFIREDLDWNIFANYLVNNFAKPPKLIYEACSDASECYALALSLINKLGAKASDYFPIIARDIDENIIQNPKKGIVGITEMEKMQMQGKFANIDFNKYFSRSGNEVFDIETGSGFMYHINDELKNAVNFEVKNLKESSKEKFAEPTVIFVRNVAHQMPMKDFLDVIKSYKQNLPHGSLFINGSVENHMRIWAREALDETFKPVNEANKQRFSNGVMYQSVRKA